MKQKCKNFHPKRLCQLIEVKQSKATMYSQGNYTELEFTQDDIDAICTSGANDIAVKEWATQNATQLDRLSDDNIKKELREYGCWSEAELSNMTKSKQRLAWILAWNLFDEMEETEGERFFL